MTLETIIQPAYEISPALISVGIISFSLGICIQGVTFLWSSIDKVKELISSLRANSNSAKAKSAELRGESPKDLQKK